MTFHIFYKSFILGMREFGQCISVIINSLLLLCVYIVGVGLTSIYAKLTKKNLLNNKLLKRQKSYWFNTNIGNKSTASYYRQF